ncbi:MAG: cyclic nucleotide-binding domain-containing protein [Planctomycetes bacterium]|nr:cyclic nucleotide-binding domain-containing protein [Planctomycetota bacterium]
MRAAFIREFGENEVLCKQGTKADRIFILKHGTLRSVVIPDRDIENADDARILRGRDLNLHMENDLMLGIEGALLGKFTESLVAAETTTAIEVPLDNRSVLNMITEDSEFGLSLARFLARKLVAANRALGGAQREAARFMRELQGLCTDFVEIVRRIEEDAGGEGDVLGALKAAQASWTYRTGEVGSSEPTKNTSTTMHRAVEDKEEIIGTQHRLNKGDLLCRRGDPGKSVYILVSGRLSVRVGQEVYGIVRPGETVGEISVLLGEEEPKRAADVQAEEPSVVGCVPGEMFPQLAKTQPKLLINTSKLLAIRAQNMQQLMADSDGALRAVEAKFMSPNSTFVADVTALTQALGSLIDKHDYPLHMEQEQLTRLGERWSRKCDELNARINRA